MVKELFTSALLLTCPLLASADGFRNVDLNLPGAMDTLRISNPAHYNKLQRIFRRLQTGKDCDVADQDATHYQQTAEDNCDVPRWLRTDFNAKDIYYDRLVWLTSLPPKRDLSFVLDNTRYRARITLDPDGAQIHPVINR